MTAVIIGNSNMPTRISDAESDDDAKYVLYCVGKPERVVKFPSLESLAFGGTNVEIKISQVHVNKLEFIQSMTNKEDIENLRSALVEWYNAGDTLILTHTFAFDTPADVWGWPDYDTPSTINPYTCVVEQYKEVPIATTQMKCELLFSYVNS